MNQDNDDVNALNGLLESMPDVSGNESHETEKKKKISPITLVMIVGGGVMVLGMAAYAAMSFMAPKQKPFTAPVVQTASPPSAVPGRPQDPFAGSAMPASPSVVQPTSAAAPDQAKPAEAALSGSDTKPAKANMDTDWKSRLSEQMRDTPTSKPAHDNARVADVKTETKKQEEKKPVEQMAEQQERSTISCDAKPAHKKHSAKKPVAQSKATVIPATPPVVESPWVQLF